MTDALIDNYVPNWTTNLLRLGVDGKCFVYIKLLKQTLPPLIDSVVFEFTSRKRDFLSGTQNKTNKSPILVAGVSFKVLGRPNKNEFFNCRLCRPITSLS